MGETALEHQEVLRAKSAGCTQSGVHCVDRLLPERPCAIADEQQANLLADQPLSEGFLMEVRAYLAPEKSKGKSVP
ncbi:hypothetical protein GCM10020331_006790 [Ectobacillus funiculus]